MNYKLHYDRLISKSLSREKPRGYCEEHHILPSALGGGDNKENLVWLTAREHYVAHLLLAKIYGGKMWSASKWMGGVQGRQNSKMYAVSREKHKEFQAKIGEKVGKTHWKNKTGIFAKSKEEWSKQTRLAGLLTKELGIGLFGRSKEKRQKDAAKAGRIGGKAVSSVRCECLQCGLISNPGSITNHQTFKGHIGRRLLPEERGYPNG